MLTRQHLAKPSQCIPLGFLLLCLLAALAPWLRGWETAPAAAPAFPGWPTHFEGRALQALPMTPLEERFQQDFPGRVGRFTDGQREIVLRWVTQETRKLHASADCFKANGYRIKPLPLHRQGQEVWSSFTATRGAVQLRVTERIAGPQGRQWSDVSAWYWAAWMGRSAGPWWAVTVASTVKAP